MHTYSLGKQRPGTKAGKPFYRCEVDHSQSAGVGSLHVMYVCRQVPVVRSAILNHAYNAQRNGGNGLPQALVTQWIFQVSTFFDHIQ